MAVVGFKPTYRCVLREVALDQYGYVTTSDARSCGVPVVELPKLAARGGLSRIGYGLYRFDDIPATDQDLYMEATLRVGSDAYLGAETVLAFHNLAFVNPLRISVVTSRRVRAKLPGWVKVVSQTGPVEIVEYDGIRSMTVKDALLGCVGHVMPERLVEACHDAADQGLLDRRDTQHVLAKIRKP